VAAAACSWLARRVGDGRLWGWEGIEKWKHIGTIAERQFLNKIRMQNQGETYLFV